MNPKDLIWNFFYLTEDGGKIKCKDCKMVISTKSERFKTHRLKCCGTAEQLHVEATASKLTHNADPRASYSQPENAKPLTPAERKLTEGKFFKLTFLLTYLL